MATTGAASDIEKATELLLEFLEKYGFDEEVGLVDLQLLIRHKLIDATKVNDRVQALAKEIEEKVVRELSSNYELVEVLAGELLEEEILSGENIKEILDGVR